MGEEGDDLEHRESHFEKEEKVAESFPGRGSLDLYDNITTPRSVRVKVLGEGKILNTGRAILRKRRKLRNLFQKEDPQIYMTTLQHLVQ